MVPSHFQDSIYQNDFCSFSFEIHPSKGGNPPWPDPKDSSDSLDFTNHIPRPFRLGVTDKMRIEETKISVSAGNREIIFNSPKR